MLAAWAGGEDLKTHLKDHPPKGFYGEVHRFVFFAVLEGCLEDGVTQGEIDLMIPLREEGSPYRLMTTNLVYSCPLCSPVFDALRLYSDRQVFITGITKESSYNTFGQGLEPEVKGELAKKGKPCRDAIQKLVRGWIERRMEKLRLTVQEEAELRKELAEMREEGEASLKKLQAGELGEQFLGLYDGWEECPVCSGAAPMGGR
ncbi:MAG: hypothetical protein AAGC74_07855 [Verrucomicrobiota bacterium]